MLQLYVFQSDTQFSFPLNYISKVSNVNKEFPRLSDTSKNMKSPFCQAHLCKKSMDEMDENKYNN